MLQSNAGDTVGEPLMTAKDASKILRVTLQKVYAMARAGQLPTVRVGQRVRFEPTALRSWIAQGGCGVVKNGQQPTA